jgi:hypothetical protein
MIMKPICAMVDQASEVLIAGERRHDARRFDQKRREADEKDAARIHESGVKKGRNRCRRFHHLRQPAVEWKLRGLENGRSRNQRHGAGQLCRWPRLGKHAHDGRYVSASGHPPQDHEGGQEENVGEPSRQILLRCSSACERAVGVEEKELAQGKAGGNPCKEEDDEVAGLDKDHDGAQRQAHPSEEAKAALLVAHGRHAVADDDEAEKRDQHEQGRAHAVDQRKGTGMRARIYHPCSASNGQDERQCGAGFKGARRPARGLCIKEDAGKRRERYDKGNGE